MKQIIKIMINLFKFEYVYKLNMKPHIFSAFNSTEKCGLSNRELKTNDYPN